MTKPNYVAYTWMYLAKHCANNGQLIRMALSSMRQLDMQLLGSIPIYKDQMKELESKVDDNIKNEVLDVLKQISSLKRVETLHYKRFVKACEIGEIATVKDIINKYNVNEIMSITGECPKNPYEEDGEWTALAIAFANGRLKICQYLIEGFGSNYLKLIKSPSCLDKMWFSDAKGEAFVLCCAIKMKRRRMLDYLLNELGHIWRWDHMKFALNFAIEHDQDIIKDLVASHTTKLIFSSMKVSN
jgi:hypothetical protein